MVHKDGMSLINYKKIIVSAFERHYKEGSDVWSQDRSLVECTELALMEMNRLIPNTKLNVLDIGCGNGRHIHSLNKALSYTGIDLVVHENWKSLTSENISFVQDDFLPWATNNSSKFNLIIDNGCFHHQPLEDIPSYLKGVLKLGEVNSYYSLVVWGELFKEGNVDNYGRYHFHYSSESLTELLESFNFQVLAVNKIKSLIGKTQLHAISKIR